MEEIIGWGSALILLPTFGLQTYRQWKNRHEPIPESGLWFFILALAGTGGQAVYSWMIGNWVYLALNGCLVVNNGVGLGIALHRRNLRQSDGIPDIASDLPSRGQSPGASRSPTP